MRSFRFIAGFCLLILPVIGLIGVGAYALWVTDRAFWVWWPAAALMAVGYLMVWSEIRRVRRQKSESAPPMHWTDRDRSAWQLVVRSAEEFSTAIGDRVNDPKAYFDEASRLSQQLAKCYKPEAADPFGQVTVPEILAVIELASHDLNQSVTSLVPGAHLMTIDHWRQARNAVQWYRIASKVFWVGSAVLDPIRTGIRYVAARYGIGKPMSLVQDNAVRWLQEEFVRRVGHYLIELYAGRLRVGAVRYRQLRGQMMEPAATPDTSAAPAAPERSVRFVVIGQTGAGKSSLINALIGKTGAETAAVPSTDRITRFDLPGGPAVLDTPGYDQAGAGADLIETTARAAEQADALLLVLNARTAARQADVDFVRGIETYYRNRPELRIPPIGIIVTHVDLLRPAMEWNPPYDWLRPKRAKEESIGAAIAAVRELFPGRTAVPVRTDVGAVWGIDEWVRPLITAMVDEGAATAFVRAIHQEADEGKFRRVFEQMRQAGSALLTLVTQENRS